MCYKGVRCVLNEDGHLHLIPISIYHTSQSGVFLVPSLITSKKSSNTERKMLDAGAIVYHNTLQHWHWDVG